MRAQVVHFFSVTPPAWLGSSVARDLPFARGLRISGDVHLPVPRFVRGISDPFAVGRKLAVAVMRVSFQERLDAGPAGGHQCKIGGFVRALRGTQDLGAV